MNSILGFSEILADELHGPLGHPQYQDYARIIRESGETLLGLVNQLLEIARLESQMRPVSRERLDLRATLALALSAVEADLARRSVTVRLNLTGAGHTVLADRRSLRTVLANLLNQAAAFAPEAGEIHIRSVGMGDRTELLIEDAGPTSCADRARGWALASSICFALAQTMGGGLAMEDRLNGGVRARLSLPCG